jgi:hypothetical protein
MANTIGKSAVFGCIEISKLTGIPAGVKWRVRQRPDRFATVACRWPDGGVSHHYIMPDDYGGYIMSTHCIGRSFGSANDEMRDRHPSKSADNKKDPQNEN